MIPKLKHHPTGLFLGLLLAACLQEPLGHLVGEEGTGGAQAGSRLAPGQVLHLPWLSQEWSSSAQGHWPSIT